MDFGTETTTAYDVYCFWPS